MITDATAQAELVRNGDASPTELVREAIDRIEQRNPTLNAVIHPMFEKALDAAASPDLPDGPFRGVPIVLKDLSSASAGDPLHQGVAALKDAAYVHPTDSNLIQRYREAGFVIVGRTNTAELGLSATTEPKAYGPTRNPWNTDHGPGGSSGGAAAAVASGMVAIAHATDAGGSIRIPAAMCGLVGLKTSRGRTSSGPLVDEWNLSVHNAVCHTVRDCARMLDASAIPSAGDGVVAPPPAQPYAELIGSAPGPLRIGLLTTTPHMDVHPECAAVAERTAAMLEELGHHVEQSSPPELFDPDAQLAVNTVRAVAAVHTLSRVASMLGREVQPEDVEGSTWAIAERGRAVPGPDAFAAMDVVHRYRRAVAQWWASGCDVLLTPTTAEPPPPIGLLAASDDPSAMLRSAPYAVFTAPFNATGQPAISLPLGRTSDGLPIGAQLVGAYGREDLLLQVARQLEDAQPWAAVAP